MTKHYKFFLSIAFIGFASWLTSCSNSGNPVSLQDKLIQKYETGIPSFINKDRNPRTIEPNGEIRMVPSGDWTSGFYPGSLWYLYELSGDSLFLEAAENRTLIVKPEMFNSTTHDMGFKVYCSFGNGYRITKNEEYKAVLLQSAKTLIKRFNPNVGCIRSWDHHAHVWDYPVIIDNMMNLELLFWAFDETGDSTYYQIANSHAQKTLENHFRDNNSCYHVVNYDTLTGAVINKETHQGYNHESSWARGQAWALYGFTMAYRETKNPDYLKKAQAIAYFIMHHKNLPSDKIPYWDFDDPEIPNAPRDASAAAIISSALYELSTYDSSSSLAYKRFADAIFAALASDKYLVPLASENPFLLDHSTGNMPRNDEIDCSIIYADYYFLEAFSRKQQLNKLK